MAEKEDELRVKKGRVPANRKKNNSIEGRQKVGERGTPCRGGKWVPQRERRSFTCNLMRMECGGGTDKKTESTPCYVGQN